MRRAATFITSDKSIYLLKMVKFIKKNLFKGGKFELVAFLSKIKGG